MTNPFQRRISFDQIRMKDNINNLEISATRLGLLIRQLKTLQNTASCKELLDKVAQESAYLKNSYEEIESNSAGTNLIDSFYCYIPQELKNKIVWLLDETYEVVSNYQALMLDNLY